MGTGKRARGTAREGARPDGDDEPATGRDRSTPSGIERGSTLLSDGGTNGGTGILTPRVTGGLAVVLAVGQLVGLLLVVVEPQQLYSLLDPIRFLYATPLGTITYYLVVFPEASTALWVVVGIGYIAVYAAVGWIALGDRGLSTSRTGLLKLFFASNAVLYAISPVVIVRAVNREFGGLGLAQYYTTNATVPMIVAYGVLMGVMYVGVGRMTEDPGAGEGTTGGEPAGPTAQRQPRSRSESAPPPGKPASADAAGGGSPGATRRTPAGASAGESQEQGAQRSVPRRQQGEPRGNEASQGNVQRGQPQEPSTDRNDPRRRDQQSETKPDGQPPRKGGEARGQQPEDGSTETTEPPDRTHGADESGAQPSEGDATERDRGDEESSNELVNLFEQLTASDSDERLAAAERIGEITWEDPSAVAAEPLAEAIDREPDAEIREALVVAIGSIDSEAAKEALREARFDPDPNVSTRASRLLQ